MRKLFSADNQASITIALGAAGFVLSALGWVLEIGLADLHSFGEVLARVVSAYAPKPEIFTDTKGNFLTLLGAILSLLATISGILFLTGLAMGRSLHRTFIRRFARGHTVIIGETPLAARMEEALSGEARVVRLPPASQSVLTRAGGLRRAHHLIIACGSDADTIQCAAPLLKSLSEGSQRLHSVALRVADPTLANVTSETIAQTAPGLPRPVLFDENLALARAALSQYPLYEMAAARGQARVHALIIGFGDFGEKLADQVFLTCVASDLAAPRVTVLDRQGAAKEKSMRALRPGVLEGLSYTIHPFNLGLDGFDDEAILKLEKQEPLTAIFVALPTLAETLQAILLLRQTRERSGQLAAPIFYRSRLGESEGGVFATHFDPARPDIGCTPLTLDMARLKAELDDTSERNVLARRLHENYVKTSSATGDSAAPWPELADTYRRSNIRAADHVAAKLWSLGIDTQFLKSGADLDTDTRSKLHQLLTAASSDARVTTLARLEHERWMIERKLDGWRYGRPKDTAKRIHHLLVPWEQLQKSPAEVEKDVEQVLQALRSLVD